MNFLDQIQNYWAIIVFVGGVFASWIRYELKIKDLTKEVEKIQIRNETKDKEADGFRELVLVKLEGITASMKYLVDTVGDLKKSKR